MALTRLTESFYHRDCLEVAPDLVGKLILRKFPDGTLLRERLRRQRRTVGRKTWRAMPPRAERPGQNCSTGKRHNLRLSLLWDALAHERYHRRAGTAPGRADPCRRSPQRSGKADQVFAGGQCTLTAAVSSPARNCGSPTTAAARNCAPMCVWASTTPGSTGKICPGGGIAEEI